MVRLTTVCPDCEQFVNKKIQIDQNGQAIWVCPECGFYRGKLAIEKKAAE